MCTFGDAVPSIFMIQYNNNLLKVISSSLIVPVTLLDRHVNSIPKIRQLSFVTSLPPWPELGVHPSLESQSKVFPSPTDLPLQSLLLVWHQWQETICTIHLLHGGHFICIILFGAPHKPAFISHQLCRGKCPTVTRQSGRTGDLNPD